MHWAFNCIPCEFCGLGLSSRYVKIPTEFVATFEDRCFSFANLLRLKPLSDQRGNNNPVASLNVSKWVYGGGCNKSSFSYTHSPLWEWITRTLLYERKTISKINDRALLYMHIYTHYLYYKYLNSLSIKIFLSSKSSCMITLEEEDKESRAWVRVWLLGLDNKFGQLSMIMII